MITKSNLETIEYAMKIAENSKPDDLFFLTGDLAAGKTTFVKGFVKYFKPDLNVISPTFNILKIYNINDKISNIYHFDLYRLKDIYELYDIGFEEYIYDKNSIALVEWPEILFSYIKKPYKLIDIKKIEDKEREINENLIYRDDK